MPYIITLVHGTRAPGAPWTQEGSPLRAHLTEALGEVSFEVFSWSGKNSVTARAKAAEGLRLHLYACIEKHPTGRQFIIGHSHGGNVALYALRDAKLAQQVAGTICLATPFLHITARNFSYAASDALGCMRQLYGLILAITLPAMSAWLAARRGNNQYVGAGIGAALFLGLLVAWLRFRNWLRHRAFRVWNACDMPNPVPARLLIIRSTADEASSALAFSQFASWLSSRLWTKTVEFTDRLKRLYHIHVFRWVAWVVLVALALGTIDEIALPHMPRPLPHWYEALRTWLTSLVKGGLYEKVLVWSFLIFVIGLIPVVIGPLFFAMWAIAMWAFGRELALVSPHLEISVETTPPGSWRVLHLPPDWTVNRLTEKRVGSIAPMHSSTYEDPRALRRIAQWMRKTGK
jgi:hypothetical protein